MATTAMLRQQHVDLLAIANQIGALLAPAKLEQDPSEMLMLLSKLAGRLATHLVIEDKLMYPALVGHPVVGAIADRYVEEMGGLKKAFDLYIDRWADAAAIRRDAEAFVKDTSAVLGLLAARVAKEDAELYPLIDSDGPPILRMLLRPR